MSDAKYFQTTKRGEIHELKEELHTNDKQKQKEVDPPPLRTRLVRPLFLKSPIPARWARASKRKAGASHVEGQRRVVACCVGGEVSPLGVPQTCGNPS